MSLFVTGALSRPSLAHLSIFGRLKNLLNFAVLNVKSHGFAKKM